MKTFYLDEKFNLRSHRRDGQNTLTLNSILPEDIAMYEISDEDFELMCNRCGVDTNKIKKDAEDFAEYLGLSD